MSAAVTKAIMLCMRRVSSSALCARRAFVYPLSTPICFCFITISTNDSACLAAFSLHIFEHSLCCPLIAKDTYLNNYSPLYLGPYSPRAKDTYLNNYCPLHLGPLFTAVWCQMGQPCTVPKRCKSGMQSQLTHHVSLKLGPSCHQDQAAKPLPPPSFFLVCVFAGHLVWAFGLSDVHPSLLSRNK